MRLLVIAKPDSHEAHRLAEEDADVTHASIEDVLFAVSEDSCSITVHDKELRDAYDIIVMRSFYPYISEALLLSEYAARHGIRVIDRRLASGAYVQSKMYDYWKLHDVGLPVPPTKHAMNLTDAKRVLSDMEFPIVAKGVHGSRGRYVFKIDDRAALDRQLNPEMIGSFTFQPYYVLDAEYRAIVIGGKLFGAIRKHAPENDFRANSAVGGTAEPATLSPELASLCEKAAVTLEYELAGVDLALVDGNPLILEVNRSPGFRLFEETTDKNVARAFLEYAVHTRTK